MVVMVLRHNEKKLLLYVFIYSFRIREAEQTMTDATPGFRKCANVKSKKHPDAPCTAIATKGDFCIRHWKRPHRYVTLTELRNSYLTRSYLIKIRAIQTWWRKRLPLLLYKNHGPLIHCPTLSQNDTEVYSMEPLADIPKLYFFSYGDSKKCLWTFDIRSLSHILSEGQHPTNPYTREPLPPRTLQKLRDRLMSLRRRKYPILYLQGDSLTPEQEWNQRVLDVFMKLEALGYLSACSWFHNLTLEEHLSFYRMMFQLWNWRVGLSHQEREAIVPSHAKAAAKLFRIHPDAIAATNHTQRWWQKTNLFLIQCFITRAEEKEKQKLGALYVMMGLVHVSEEAAETYPWIVETLA